MVVEGESRPQNGDCADTTPATLALDASVAQRQSATFTPWKSEGRHLPDAHGRTPPSWWMEPDGEAGGRGPPRREFDSPHSPWVSRPATQRGGMVTSRVSYARRSPVSTERCDWGGADRPGRPYRPSLSWSATRSYHLAPVAQTEEAAGPNPACARSNRVGGTSPVMLGWLSARFVRGNARVRHSPPALLACQDHIER
jgi:hypothetical protein